MFPDYIETLFIEINFWKCKWLLCWLYHSSSQSKQNFFYNLDKALDVYFTYGNSLITGDFNPPEEEKFFDALSSQHVMKSLNKETTCTGTQKKQVALISY